MSSDIASGGTVESRSRSLRFLLVHALQVPAIALIVFSDREAAWWAAGIWSSLVCCAGTDSGWRWRNRLLVAEAIAWLVAASLFGTGTVAA
jgi:hypothetical protein